MKELQLIKKKTGEYVFLPLERILSEENNEVQLITMNPFEWWIEERRIEGGAHDGIGSEVIVRDFTEKDFSNIMTGEFKCFAQTDHRGILRVAKNGRGQGKIPFILKTIKP